MALQIGLTIFVVSFFPALGWVSLRYLRAAPDFPHKPEMIRGAKWGGLIISLCMLGPAFAGLLLHRNSIAYASTISSASGMFIGAYCIVSRWWMVWEAAGVFLAFSLLGHRLRGEPIDIPAAIEKWEEQQRSRWGRALPWVGGVVFLIWVGMTVLTFLPIDRQMQAIKADRALEAKATQALGDLPLKTIMVDRQWHIWSPLMPMLGRPAMSIPGHPDASLLWVVLEGDAPEGSFERASAASEAFLEAKAMRGEWLVRVTAGDERRLDVFWQSPARE